MDAAAAVRLVDRLSSLELPDEDPDLKLDGPQDLLARLAECSDPRGRYFASPRMVARMFWWARVPVVRIERWLMLLEEQGDIAISHIAGSSYSPGLVPILTIQRRHRFARFAPRPAIPDAVRQMVYARDGYRCLHCGTDEWLSLDHIYPYSLGGSDDPENLQTLCRPCNSRKGARLIEPAEVD